MIRAGKSHPASESRQKTQTKDETEIQVEPYPAARAGVFTAATDLAAATTEQLNEPHRKTSPRHPTHYEPSGSVPEPHFLYPKGRQAARCRFPPGGQRPIVARLRRAYGRAHGRPAGSDLRSLGIFGVALTEIPARHFTGLMDIGGMGENSAQVEPFFTERTLADYLAVSDRTIRNWIRRGELPSYKLGASRRIDPADVDAFLAERRDEAA